MPAGLLELERLERAPEAPVRLAGGDRGLPSEEGRAGTEGGSPRGERRRRRRSTARTPRGARRDARRRVRRGREATRGRRAPPPGEASSRVPRRGDGERGRPELKNRAKSRNFPGFEPATCSRFVSRCANNDRDSARLRSNRRFASLRHTPSGSGRVVMGSDDDDDDGRGLAEVTFRDLTPENEPELRRLNAVIFPIRYSVRPDPRRSPPRASRRVPSPRGTPPPPPFAILPLADPAPPHPSPTLRTSSTRSAARPGARRSSRTSTAPWRARSRSASSSSPIAPRAPARACTP